MKVHLRVAIAGGTSESKNGLADDLKEFFIARGYHSVSVIKSTQDQPWDGMLMDENVEITVL